ncbi:MAG: hypothetical protein IPN38_00510 [Flavobacteriales bacterium]|nr:hypothetical protein [Flavobacteriales bacterium]
MTALPRPWPIIDDPTFPNVSSFGTLETPYSTFWEDGRHQFLYRAADMATLNICPLTDITAIAFQCPAGGGQQFRNVKVNMKNTLSASQATLDLAGLVPFGDYAVTPFTPVAGWNIHQWNVANPPYQWQLGFNMLVEFCFDNQDWTGNVAVNSENTTYLANYSLYCDACGGTGGPCFYTGPCNANNAIPRTGIRRHPLCWMGLRWLGGWRLCLDNDHASPDLRWNRPVQRCARCFQQAAFAGHVRPEHGRCTHLA